MAKYDHGGGCACGLEKYCDCSQASAEDLRKAREYGMKFQNSNTYMGNSSSVVITEKPQPKTTILLHSGNYFDFNNFDNLKYTIEDIAHGLSMTCRFGGQCIKFYSVAEHAYWVSFLVPSHLAFIGLMHDASEAFLGDIPKPLKNLLLDYVAIEKNVEEAMMKRFGIQFPFPPEIKKADRAILLTEQQQNMNKSHLFYNDIEPADIQLQFWAPEKAKFMFLKRFYELCENPL